MYQTSRLLQFAENELQVVALLFMATVYTLKIRWILHFPAGKDRQALGGNSATNPLKGATKSLLAIAMPWTMASTRNHLFLYAQFVTFHLGVAASIAISFLIPYAPELLQGRGTVLGLQVLFALAAMVGAARFLRRVSDPYMRAMSSPDDYFSLALLIVWLVFSALAVPNHAQDSEFSLLAYFLLTAFFLIYVPFSKVSHYLYYPFARWYLGRTLGHRGVYPLVKGA